MKSAAPAVEPRSIVAPPPFMTQSQKPCDLGAADAAHRSPQTDYAVTEPSVSIVQRASIANVCRVCDGEDLPPSLIANTYSTGGCRCVSASNGSDGTALQDAINELERRGDVKTLAAIARALDAKSTTPCKVDDEILLRYYWRLLGVVTDAFEALERALRGEKPSLEALEDPAVIEAYTGARVAIAEEQARRQRRRAKDDRAAAGLLAVAIARGAAL